GVADQPGFRRDRTGRRDADETLAAGRHASLTLYLRDQVADQPERRRIVARRRRTHSRQEPSVAVERRRFDLGPSEIDPDADHARYLNTIPSRNVRMRGYASVQTSRRAMPSIRR